MDVIEKILFISNRVYEHRWSTAIRKGLLLNMPFIIIGAFATLLSNLPIKYYTDFMNNTFGGSWIEALRFVNNVTSDITALCLVLTISYSLASVSPSAKGGKLNPIIVSLVSFISFLLLTISKKHILLEKNSAASGVFLAIIIALISTELFIFLFKRKYLRFENIRIEEEPVISQALMSIIPSILVIIFFGILYYLVPLSGYKSVNDLLNGLIVKSFFNIRSPLLFVVVLNVVNQILWYFGIHGNILLHETSQVFFDKFTKTNNSAIAAGHLHNVIFTKSFMDVFVLIGGSGATICLLIAILLTARRSDTSRLAKISLIPGIFNINEIIVFGLPIVLNPIFLIPFLVTPIVFTLTAYSAIKLGLVPPALIKVSWSTPPLLNGYLSTGSWKGLAMQLFNICLGTMIYLPFVKLNEIRKDLEVRKTFKTMIQILENKSFNSSQVLLSRDDKVGNLARTLSKEIKEAIIKDGFSLEYQPQIDKNNYIIGVEALLRWTHYKFDQIPPIVAITIAEESGLMNDLGRWVLNKACSQLGDWNAKGIKGLQMSINISPTQFHDKELLAVLSHCIKEYNLDPKDIELEITESTAIDVDSFTLKTITEIKKLGVNLAMDDFGMGYTSLLYMKYFSISTIKIDGSLTRDILKDKSCQDIISSMIYLCNSMKINVIAEYVETEGQKDLLNLLGCGRYQGYLFSPSLTSEKCYEYINKIEQKK